MLFLSNKNSLKTEGNLFSKRQDRNNDRNNLLGLIKK